MKTFIEKREIIFTIREKRTRYEKLRKLKRGSSHESRQNSQKMPSTSDVLEEMKKWCKVDKSKRFRETVIFNIPEVFSILDRPRDAFKFIYDSLSNLLKFKKIDNLCINHEKMVKFDLAAEILFDYFISEIENNSSQKHFVYGHYPQSELAKRFIRGIGIIDELNINHEKLSSIEQKSIEIFKAENRKYQSSVNGVSKTYYDETIQRFSKHIDNCLQHINRNLTQNGRSRLCQYISEILDNIHEHAGMEKWRIAGYLDTKSKDLPCEVCIFNFGNTIAKTFENLDYNNPIHNQIKLYTEKHKNYATQENLLTLYALQGNVSSKNIDANSSRGQGTIELLSFFQDLHIEIQDESTNSRKMVIISGSTCIILDYSCKMVKKNERHIMPLNKQQDLDFPPDKMHLKELKETFFPGTLISLRFNLPYTLTAEVSS